MNLQDEATKYGATFTPPQESDFHALASKYGATYSPPQTQPTQDASSFKLSSGQPAPTSFSQSASGQAINQAGQGVMKNVSDFQSKPSLGNLFQQGFNVAGNIAKGVVGAITSPFSGAIQQGSEQLSQNKTLQNVATSQPVSAGLDAVQSLSDKSKALWNTLQSTHPQIAQNIQNAGNIAQFMTLAGTEPTANKVIEKGAPIANKVGGVVEDLGNQAKVDFSAASQARSTAQASKMSGQATNNALEAITPSTKELTPTEYQDLLGKQKISPKTTTAPAKYILSDAEKATATKYQGLLQSKDPVKNSINVINKIADTDKQVGNFLRQNNGTFNGGELKNYILSKLKDVNDITVPEGRLNKLKTTMVDGFVKALPKKDMESLWTARKAFDRSIEKVFSGSPTLQNTVKREFRNSIQDFISDRTPDGVYKQSMKDMRELFNIQDTLATKASKEKTLTGITSWIKQNPTKAKIIGWGVGAGGIGGAYKLLTQ